jgi:hypothetical protein
MDPQDPRETLSTVRTSLRPKEPWRAVLFAARFAQFRPLEVVALPEEEAHRLVWMGVAESVGFEADAARGEAEHRRRVVEG